MQSSSNRSVGGTLDSRDLHTTNGNQLDNLLDDLKQERTIERDLSNIGIDEGLMLVLSLTHFKCN